MSHYNDMLQTPSKQHEPSPTDVSHIMFSIGGSVATWHTRRHYAELWWRPNTTRGFVWLDQDPYKVSGDTSSFKYTCPYGTRSAIRMARIVKESFELGLENVRWFVMGDDDTVFFPDNLVTVLSKYDHNQMYYVGGNSESVEQNLVHFYTMAYGGGGLAISYSLAKELVKILDGCIDRYAHLFGSDQKIQSCISEIGVEITKELGFHQDRLYGSNDISIITPSGTDAPLVSLHHLDYVDPIFPNLNRSHSFQNLVNTYKTDPGRILQKSFCYDRIRKWTVSVSWGYSVELYPSLVTAKDLEMAFGTFQTWSSWRPEPFTLNTRPVNNDPCVMPLVYLLDEVGKAGLGESRSWYKRNGGEECQRDEYKEALAVEYVDVLASPFTQEMWMKAPRRQCCEVMNNGGRRMKTSSFQGNKFKKLLSQFGQIAFIYSPLKEFTYMKDWKNTMLLSNGYKPSVLGGGLAMPPHGNAKEGRGDAQWRS
ncbi:hypothetical protein PIB30_055157 [Stylosanthes scabra]|uniref:N-acetylgalactosaminide beta-1,3-galactosyltransferase n=1 Tax=Stylosanthes scabra TaxID=79078 RepID=A0ABU6SIX6_9FABA|nr:hypothetical protein [Stylosanthes scabra]